MTPCRIRRADQKPIYNDKLLQSSLVMQEFCILMVNRIQIWDTVFQRIIMDKIKQFIFENIDQDKIDPKDAGFHWKSHWRSSICESSGNM
jgi:hypothetical protein